MTFTDAEIDAIVCPECESEFLYLVHGDGDVVWCTACHHIYYADAATLAVIDDANATLPAHEQAYWKDLAAGLVPA